MSIEAGSSTRSTSLTSGSSSAQRVDAGGDRLADAAAVLDVHRRPATRVELHHVAVLVDEVGDLAVLAAEADEEVRPDVRVRREPGQHALELLVVGAFVLHPAAALVGEGHDAVHVREVAEQIAARFGRR